MATLVNTVMNFQFPQNAGNLLTGRETVNLYRKILLHKVTKRVHSHIYLRTYCVFQCMMLEI